MRSGPCNQHLLTSTLEGAPTVLCAVVVYFRLPDSPDPARFLTENEKLQARQRLATVNRTEKSKGELDASFPWLDRLPELDTRHDTLLLQLFFRRSVKFLADDSPRHGI